MFALDFVVGADLQPRFLEANEAPAMCSHNREGEDCLDVPCAEWCAALCRLVWFGFEGGCLLGCAPALLPDASRASVNAGSL
eukprot:COSAG04_NODE_891_length_9607_cov_13.087085_7_plen_82_part_00